jgi:hypothetical protein
MCFIVKPDGGLFEIVGVPASKCVLIGESDAAGNFVSLPPAPFSLSASCRNLVQREADLVTCGDDGKES